MNCLEIIKAYLKENGYDGLCCRECGCGLDDLVPCSDDMVECVPAYRVGDIYKPTKDGE